MLSVASCTTVSVAPAGIERCSFGSSFLMRCTVSITLAPGWRWMSTTMAGIALIEAADLVVLEAVDHVGHVPQQHRRAVAIGDDDVAIGRRPR